METKTKASRDDMSVYGEQASQASKSKLLKGILEKRWGT